MFYVLSKQSFVNLSVITFVIPLTFYIKDNTKICITQTIIHI